ncbi:MAG: hypothetical protein CL868_07315 [Cytophagaceae bacterium]|nr:hypothetical protein [Cytophagaceae bacterium]|tara:strand:- start:16139 stop:16489 length:351 start_codon:yes stop_codon:yes gene_type:complete
MKHIDIIFKNDHGISFFWKKNEQSTVDLAQVVFRDIGFYLTLDELKEFSNLVSVSLQHAVCQNCPHGKDCRSFLLKTPAAKIDLAISLNELNGLQELLDKTIIKMDTIIYIQGSLN